MLRLSDFFQPLNFLSLLQFALAILFFDILGTGVKHIFIRNKKIEAETRLVNWLVGLSFFIFIWFILGFIVYPSQKNILISAVVLLAMSIIYYLKGKEFLSLVAFIKSLVLPIVLIIPLLPSTFVKSSLPPYYSDEMAYHFISPYAMLYQLKTLWNFSGGALMNAPRLMDTFYLLGFSVFHTYSIVRLIQFTILITALLSLYLIIKKHIGLISALMFLLIIFSMKQLSLPFTATVGYVDVPAYSFMMVGIALGIEAFYSNSSKYLILSIIFWGMSVGTKYTTLTGFVAFAASFLIAYLIKNKPTRVYFNRKIIAKILIGFVIFGGYWYIKNFVVYGNPIYPFLFSCWGNYAKDCGTTSSFFGNWTTPVNVHTFYTIIKDLISENIYLHIVLLASPLLVVVFGNKKLRLLLILLILSFGLEMLILKYSSGYFGRYQQHLQIFLMLIIVLPLSFKFKQSGAKVIQTIVIVAVFVSCSKFYFRNMQYLNSLNFVNWDEINYAIGKTNIYDWVKKRLPNEFEALVWCENPPNGLVSLARFDPDMIWFQDDGFIRSFLINCDWQNPYLGFDDWDNVSVIARERKLKFWTISPNPCVPYGDVKAKQELLNVNYSKEELDKLLLMRKLNNSVVCNSKQVLPNLYYFDYEKLNK